MDRKSRDEDKKKGAMSMVVVVKNKDGAESVSEEGIIDEGKSGDKDENEGGASMVVVENRNNSAESVSLKNVDTNKDVSLYVLT